MAEKLGNSIREKFARLIKNYDYERPRRGEVREATILSIGENDMLVDLGGKRDGIIPPRDLELVDDEAYVESLEVGDRIPVVMLKPRADNQTSILVSLNKGLQKQDWLRAQEMIETNEVIEAPVVDHNRGGVLVDFGHLEGFVPNSHLSSIPRGTRGKRLKQAKADLVGETLSLMVIEVNQRRRRLVLSERQANYQQRQALLEELTKGDVLTGVVRNLVDFGAFVDLGGIDGLIHISELDWRHIDEPADVLDVGDEVEVYVLEVDRERERIALSRKRLLPDPWESVVRELNEGDVVEGTVTDIVDFGAFVDIGKGVEGLLHTSEVPGEGVGPDLESGASIPVRILNINEWKHQISLGLAEEEALPAEDSAEESAEE